ncbi:MAG: ATP-binding protein [Ignavibacteriales bacterium]|nr:ATP-binding protein [Ignavibacteriales bacterium]
MKQTISRLRESIGQYRFEIRHLTVLFVILIIFQIIISFVHKISLQKILVSTQEWYQQDSAERLANLTTTSLELLLESRSKNDQLKQHEVNKIIQDLNIILSQQYLQQNVHEICLLVKIDSVLHAIDDGHILYSYVFGESKRLPSPSREHDEAIRMYASMEKEFAAKEQIHTIVAEEQTFHIFVPFVPRGELAGAVYMRNKPDFSIITNEMISGYDETSITYSALILFGLLAMFYISSYTLKERNKAQELLFEEQKKHLAEQINIENEMLFTKRIYHTHHKAEKIMGFIKEDIRSMTTETIDVIKIRINKYANFIARVIYDMKWYNPPVQTIRSQIFNTNLNDVLRFLVDHVFKRLSLASDAITYKLELDDSIPISHINEFVVWEVFEPIVQNSIDHAENNIVTITIKTEFDIHTQQTRVIIMDNGNGVEPWLLERDSKGLKKIFLEHTSTKRIGGSQHSGYGCYIAYEIATQRCGWVLDAENLPDRGCKFTFIIPNT